ncbi:MAG: hypothetical protein ACLQDQ_04075 [Myxococcaceae bacterium]
MGHRLWAVLGLLCACGGGIYVDGTLPTTTPSITSFTALPAALGAGGGTSILSWTVLYADSLSLSPGGGNVSGATSKAVRLTATTTYVLTAFNSLGDSSSNVTVTVGP